MDDLPIRFSFVEGIAVVSVDGACTIEVMGLVGAAVEKLLARGYQQVVLDFHRFEQISTAAIGVFMATIEESRERGADLALVVPHYRVYNVFDSLGFRRLFPVHRSVADAIEDVLYGDDDEDYVPET